MVSLLALSLALALVALVSLEPWESDSLTPDLSVSPELGIGLGDSVAVAPAPGFGLAEARPAPAARPTLVDNRSEPSPSNHLDPELGLSENRVVQDPAPPASALGRPHRPQGHSPPPDAPAPTSVPVAAPTPEAAPVPVPTPEPELIADFGRPRLQSVLGGDDGDSGVVAVQIREDEEYAFAFSFQIVRMVYGEPGADNLILQLKSDAGETPSFGLQLWDYAVDEWQGDWRGLWASGEAAGGDRFLAPVAEQEWHDVIFHFQDSSQETGFYEVFLDGQLVDTRSGADLIAPGSSQARIELGLFRDGERVQGTSEILFDAARLGSTLESVLSE